MTALTVLSTGPLATTQDFGRPRFAHVGVPRSGAADRPALALANRLVGNVEDAPAVEVTLGGWSARADGRVLVAVTGPAVRVTVDGADVGSHAAVSVGDGAVIEVHTPTRGCRNYVAVRGGLEVAAELGSCSTDTLSGLGPPPLSVGDGLVVGQRAAQWPATTFAPAGQIDDVTVLVADRGPRDNRLVDVEVIGSGLWCTGSASNRVGVRLDRPDQAAPLPRHLPDLPELRSEGVPLGGVQIPPSGQPVVFLADHPVTGGYPVVAVLTAESLARAAQLAPGSIARILLR